MSPASSPSDSQAIVAQPIDSIAELHHQHSSLLQREVAGNEATKPLPGELLAFLESASKLGRALANDIERRTAQGVMDFWIASLLSQEPDAADGTRPFTLEPYDESRADSQTRQAHQLRTEAAEAAKRADDILPTPPPILEKPFVTCVVEFIPEWLRPIALKVTGSEAQDNLVSRLLLRFVDLKEGSLEPYALPLRESDEVLSNPAARELLEQLLKAGVIRRQEGLGYTLTHDSLLTRWGQLQELITQRRAFRELARGWENGGRQPAALISSGEQITQALEYAKLDETEQAFREASRRIGEGQRRFAVSFLSILLMVLSGLSGWLVWSNGELARSNADLKKTQEKLSISNQQLSERYQEVVQRRFSLEQAQRELQQSLAVAETTRSPLYSLVDLLKSGQALPTTLAPEVRTPVINILTAFKERYNRKAQPHPQGHQMVEFFVPTGSSLESLARAAEFVNAAKKAQFDVPAGVVLPRSHAEVVSEVRYYHAEDKALADELIQQLKAQAGLIAPIKTRLISDDHSAPKRFLQVALAMDAIVPPAAKVPAVAAPEAAAPVIGPKPGL